jgi:hypothetical protein
MLGDFNMRTNNRDIGIAFTLAIAMLFAAWLIDEVVVRTVLAFSLLFFVTGHLALRAVGIALPPLEHALAAVGMSLAVCLAGCFVLYGLSALSPIGWACWVLFVVGALSVWITRRGLPGGLVIEWPGMRRWHVVMMSIAALIAVGAYWLAIEDEASTREFSYTEFWLVPSKPGKLILGIKSGEFEPQTYDVSVTTRTGVIAELHSIKLDPGEVWTHSIDSTYRTEATLYLDKGNTRSVYRRVSALPASGMGVE